MCNLIIDWGLKKNDFVRVDRNGVRYSIRGSRVSGVNGGQEDGCGHVRV